MELDSVLVGNVYIKDHSLCVTDYYLTFIICGKVGRIGKIYEVSNIDLTCRRA